MKIRLTEGVRELIIYKRKKRNLTQKEVSDIVGISHQTFQRIENGVNKNADREVLKRICEALEISWSGISADRTEAKTYRLPIEIIEKIALLKKKKGFSSETEAVIFILNEYLTNEDFKGIRFEIEELIEDTIVKTFIKEMKKIGREKDNYKEILQLIESNEDINIKKYSDEYEEKLYRKIHNERMK